MGLGLAGVSILLLAAVASNPGFPPPLMRASASKSLNQFGMCFSRLQERAGRAWAFVPNENGGTFTDSGAAGVAAPYQLQVSERGPVSLLRLFVARSSGRGDKLVQAVDQCR